MSAPTTQKEALHAIAVKSGVLAYCARHDAYYRGSEGLDAAMACFDRHLADVRRFFSSPVAFYTALKYARTEYPDTYCRGCTNAVRFV
ncbi:MAG: hypothetical protein ABWX83_05010 [Luteibacter sp.]